MRRGSHHISLAQLLEFYPFFVSSFTEFLNLLDSELTHFRMEFEKKISMPLKMTTENLAGPFIYKNIYNLTEDIILASPI